MNCDWSFVDKAYCISLRENKQSRIEFKNTCDTIGLAFEFLIVDRHPKGGKLGCFESHQIVARMALESGAKNAMIFEDDARLFEGSLSPIRLFRLKQELEKNEHELVYFGHMPMMFAWIKQLEPGSCLARCTSSWMSHSYFVSRSFLQKIVDEKYDDEHYDHFLHRVSEADKRFVVYPMMFYQDDRPGCISPTWLLSATTSIAGATAITESMAYNPVTSVVLIILFIVVVVWLIAKFLTPQRRHKTNKNSSLLQSNRR